jgi:hypothetical protein
LCETQHRCSRLPLLRFVELLTDHILSAHVSTALPIIHT